MTDNQSEPVGPGLTFSPVFEDISDLCRASHNWLFNPTYDSAYEDGPDRTSYNFAMPPAFTFDESTLQDSLRTSSGVREKPATEERSDTTADPAPASTAMTGTEHISFPDLAKPESGAVNTVPFIPTQDDTMSVRVDGVEREGVVSRATPCTSHVVGATLDDGVSTDHAAPVQRGVAMCVTDPVQPVPPTHSTTRFSSAGVSASSAQTQSTAPLPGTTTTLLERGGTTYARPNCYDAMRTNHPLYFSGVHPTPVYFDPSRSTMCGPFATPSQNAWMGGDGTTCNPYAAAALCYPIPHPSLSTMRWGGPEGSTRASLDATKATNSIGVHDGTAMETASGAAQPHVCLPNVDPALAHPTLAAQTCPPPPESLYIFNWDYKRIYKVPIVLVRHLPPSRLNITRLVFCRHYRSTQPHSCPMSTSCKFVHADCDYAALPSHSVHVNYVWRSESVCIYPRLPAGTSLEVHTASREVVCVRSERVLRTAGARHATTESTFCCVDYDHYGVCYQGEDCPRIHRIVVDPTVQGFFKRAPRRIKDYCPSPLTADDGTANVGLVTSGSSASYVGGGHERHSCVSDAAVLQTLNTTERHTSCVASHTGGVVMESKSNAPSPSTCDAVSSPSQTGVPWRVTGDTVVVTAAPSRSDAACGSVEVAATSWANSKEDTKADEDARHAARPNLTSAAEPRNVSPSHVVKSDPSAVQDTAGSMVSPTECVPATSSPTHVVKAPSSVSPCLESCGEDAQEETTWLHIRLPATAQVREMLRDAASVGTLLLLPRGATEAIALGPVKRSANELARLLL